MSQAAERGDRARTRTRVRCRRGIRLAAFGVLGLLGVTLAGCSHTFERDYVLPGFRANKIQRLAVLPLENHATRERAGQVVSRVLATELYARGFPVIPSQDVYRALKLDPLDPETPLSRMRVPEIGRALKADYVIVGEVGEYHYKRDLGEDPVVGFSIRMAETRTGRLVWAATHSRSEHGLFYHKHFLHENAQRVAEAMVEAFTELAGPPAAGRRSAFDTQAPPPPKKNVDGAEGAARKGKAPAAKAPAAKPPAAKAPAAKAPLAPKPSTSKSAPTRPGPGTAAPSPALPAASAPSAAPAAPATTPPASPPGSGAAAPDVEPAQPSAAGAPHSGTGSSTPAPAPVPASASTPKASGELPAGGAASSTPAAEEPTAAPTEGAAGAGEGGDAGGR